MAALGTRESQFRDGTGRVGEQALAIRGIGPRLRDDARAVARPDASLVGIDDRVDRRRIDQALFREKGFQSLHPRSRPGVVGVVMVAHDPFFISVCVLVLSCAASVLTRSGLDSLPTNR